MFLYFICFFRSLGLVPRSNCYCCCCRGKLPLLILPFICNFCVFVCWPEPFVIMQCACNRSQVPGCRVASMHLYSYSYTYSYSILVLWHSTPHTSPLQQSFPPNRPPAVVICHNLYAVINWHACQEEDFSDFPRFSSIFLLVCVSISHFACQWLGADY